MMEMLIDEIGDYQFEVYRMMRAHNGGEWSAFCPLTNVMVSFVLYYLLLVSLIRGHS